MFHARRALMTTALATRQGLPLINGKPAPEKKGVGGKKGDDAVEVEPFDDIFVNAAFARRSLVINAKILSLAGHERPNFSANFVPVTTPVHVLAQRPLVSSIATAALTPPSTLYFHIRFDLILIYRPSMAMKPPSTALLRAFFRPQQPACQLRWKSEWMPREKYAKITALDKLHRKQKVAVRKERQASEDRAANMYPVTASSESSPVQASSQSEATAIDSLTGDASITPKLSSLPYSILRTPSKNLPIYQSTKSGGSKHITTIRKIQGDLSELATAVKQALGIEEFMTDMRGRRKANIVINRTTKHVVIRGWRAPEIKRWAEMTGF